MTLGSTPGIHQILLDSKISLRSSASIEDRSADKNAHPSRLDPFCGQFHRMRSGNSRRLWVVGGSVAGQRTCALWVVGGGCYRVWRMSRSDGLLACGHWIGLALDAILSHLMRAHEIGRAHV